MNDQSLAARIRAMVDTDRLQIPIDQSLARRVVAGLADAEREPARLAALAGCDPALVCVLFRAANASLYAGLPGTDSIEATITRLGSDQATRAIEQACRQSLEPPAGALSACYLPELRRHALGCAAAARWLAGRCSYQGVAEQAYLGGLLHDFGKQSLLTALAEIVCSAALGISPSAALVEELLASMHVEQGLRLCETWHLPVFCREVVARHHDQGTERPEIVVALVRLANLACHKLGLGLTRRPEIILSLSGEAQFLGVDEITLAELEIMLEDRFPGSKPAADAGPPGILTGT